MSDLHSILRGLLRERRSAIPASERIAAAAAVAELLLRMPVIQQTTCIAGYWAVGGELPLHDLVSRLGVDVRYCLPVLQPDKRLRFDVWRTGDPVAANRFGIPEPAHPTESFAPGEVDVVLLPLLGFTRDGDRLGTGGGWYDRSFASRRAGPSPPTLIGIGFACQQLEPGYAPHVWDVGLDAIVTEREALVCPR